MIYVPQEWRCDAARWNMMRFLCLNYPRWIQEARDIKLAYRATFDAPTSGGDKSSEVERKVEELEAYTSQIELIERCCRMATEQNPEVYNALLKVVTTGVPVAYVPSPVGRRQMFKYKRTFFFILDEELSKIKIM